jgi:hypothetical protein
MSVPLANPPAREQRAVREKGRPMRSRVACVLGLFLLSCEPAESNRQAATYVLSVGVEGPGRVMSIPPGIDCPRVCSASFASGSSVTLAASPLEEGMFAAWSGDCAGSMGCFVDLQGEMRVVASFQPMAMMLTR